MSKFKYLKLDQNKVIKKVHDENYLLEIAYQLKRIADTK